MKKKTSENCSTKEGIKPRGIRNNNPLNIRHGNVWLGEVSNPTDPCFEQFATIEYGLRAAFVILRRYIRRYHHNTIRLIVSRWAPATENHTEAYIAKVSAMVGIDPDETIRYEDLPVMVKLVSAMCLVECGCTVDEKKIIKGYNMA